MQRTPVDASKEPLYPKRGTPAASAIRDWLKKTALLTSASIAFCCAGSDRHTDEPMLPPGEPPPAQLDDDHEGSEDSQDSQSSHDSDVEVE